MGHELGGALDSIRKQAFTDYEIVITDGGSTDTTAEVVRNASDLPIRFVQEPDTGVYDAMNKGIKLAQGQWLYFMGADDRLHEGVLAAVVPQFTDGALDVFYGDVILTSSGSRYDGLFDLDRLLYKKNICHQAIFYRKSVFDRIGNYNLKYKIWGDWDFNIRCFKHTDFKIAYVDVVVAIYNDQSGVSFVYDEVFCRELPLYYLNTVAALQAEKEGLLTSTSFAIGNKVVKLLEKTGMRKLFGK
jgi:glycosyltransferase involved in cell wall biosynthesis